MNVIGETCCSGIFEIRLRGGSNPFEGRVEIQHGGVWGAVCDDSWDITDATVVCHHLGYPLGAESATCCSQFGYSESKLVFLDDVSCQGQEKKLYECRAPRIGKHNCDPVAEAAGVVCRGADTKPRIKVRLKDGAEASEGRVEVFYRGEWGAVCDDFWDKRDGHVICRMLGFSEPVGVSTKGRYGPSKSRRIWLDDVRCKGNEKSITECKKRELGSSNCNYEETAGVVCKRPVTTEATPVRYRLVGGRRSNEGRIEVEYKGIWGGVCDDHWDLKNGHVICRELGYLSAVRVSCCSKYGPSPSNRIWLDDVICSGKEKSLTACDHRPWGKHNCNVKHEMVSVECIPATLPPTSPPTPEPCPEGMERTLDGKQCTEPCSIGYERAQQGTACVDRNECNSTTIASPCPYGCVNTVGSYKCVCWSGYEGDGRTCNRIPIPGPDEPHARLMDGPTPEEGRVELFRDGQWYTVCDDFWDLRDAQVICRMLGHVRATRAYCCGRYQGNITRPMGLDDVRCGGHEESISECPASEWGVHNCEDNEAAAVQCTDVVYIPPTPPVRDEPLPAKFRLAGGWLTYEGRVEVFYRGKWGAICDDSWRLRNGHVICRQLGFPLGARSVSCCSRYGGSQSGKIWLDDVSCRGNERSVMSCIHRLGSHNCNQFETAGVVCAVPTTKAPTTTPIPTTTATTTRPLYYTLKRTSYSVRLVNGGERRRGHVEVLRYGLWGSVCDEGWDIKDGNVVCRSLGYKQAESVSCCSEFGASASGQSWVKNIGCRGNETSIEGCAYQLLSGKHSCSRSTLAGVTCELYGPTSQPTTPVPYIWVRLVNGDTPLSGAIQVRYENEWRYVCDDGFGIREGSVVCRMLGYSRAIGTPCCNRFRAPAEGLFWMDDVRCHGNETTLSMCRHRGWGKHDCLLREIAGVQCASGPPTTSPYRRATVAPVVKFRLAGGPSPSEGRVELYYRDEWGAVCDDSWRIRNGHVICRHLGYPRALRVSCCSEFGPSQTRRIWLDDVNCRGRERSLMHCLRRQLGFHNCNQWETASVACDAGLTTTPPRAITAFTSPATSAMTTTSPPKTIRLVGGPGPHEGRVEILHNGEWGTVCDDFWNLLNGHVVCRMLGYPQAQSTSCCSTYGAHWRSNMWLDDVKCTGTESSLQGCAHAPIGTHDCHPGEETAGVICQQVVSLPPRTAPTTRPHIQVANPVRLWDGSSPHEGRVEVFYNGQWGAVCDDGWRIQHGHVVCRMLGFSKAASFTCCGIFTRDPPAKIWLDDVRCRGNESSLFDCAHRPWGLSNCNKKEFAGVVCHVPTVKPTLPACGAKPSLPARSPARPGFARPGDWPWQAMVMNRRLFAYCSGALVAPDVVVTAAHCFDRVRRTGEIVVRLGAHKTRSGSLGFTQDRRWEQEITVASLHKHPSYKVPTRWGHDIAVLKLSRPAILNSRTNIICLSNDTYIPPGTQCWTTGWGLILGSLLLGGPLVLRQMPLPIVSPGTCRRNYKTLHKSMICAGSGNGRTISCSGDSGGPLVCEAQNGQWDLIGVSTWGGTCGWPGFYGVYTRVTYFTNWITKIIHSHSEA